MRAFLDVMQQAALFEGIAPGELDSLLGCLGARTVSAQKDESVLRAGEPVDHVGIVLAGRFYVVREDLDGRRGLLTSLAPGDHFAEAMCCAGVMNSPVSVVASAEGTVLLMAFPRILNTCSNACAFHAKLVGNMLRVLASKNLLLQERMEILGQKNIRARLMRYFESVARQQGPTFTIPFNREELADFLCIDRSALSRELGKLKNDGVIDYWKNNFKLL